MSAWIDGVGIRDRVLLAALPPVYDVTIDTRKDHCHMLYNSAIYLVRVYVVKLQSVTVVVVQSMDCLHSLAKSQSVTQH